MEATYGKVVVSPQFLTYKLNTQGFETGTKFTDKFRWFCLVSCCILCRQTDFVHLATCDVHRTPAAAPAVATV
jgi:hypothetical protein